VVEHFQAVVNHTLLAAPLVVSLACKASFLLFLISALLNVSLYIIFLIIQK